MSKLSAYRNSLVYEQQGRRREAPRQDALKARPGGYPFGQQKSFREQIELALDMLYRRKWIILLSFVLAMAGAAYVTFPVVQRFEASSYIMVDLAPSLGAGQGGRSSVGINTAPGGDNLFAQADRTVIEELMLLQMSSPLAIRVARQLMETKVHENGRPIELLHGPTRERSIDQVASILRTRVFFSPEKGSYNIIRVTARSTIPQEATLLADMFAEEYKKLTAEAGLERTAGIRAYLTEQENIRRQELQQIEAQINENSSEGGGAGLADSDRMLVSEIAALEAERDELNLDLQLRRSQLSTTRQELDRRKALPTGQLTTDATKEISRLQQEITDLKAHKAQIESRFAPAERTSVITEELQRTDRTIRQLETSLQAASQEYVQEGASGESGLAHIVNLQQKANQEQEDIQEITARVGLLETRLAGYEERYELIPRTSTRLAELERQRVYAEQAYKYIAERLLEMRIAGSNGGGYVRVLQEAGFSLPMPSTASRNMVLAAFLGLLFGLAGAVLFDRLDNRIYKPDQLAEQGHVALGVVPNMTPDVKKHHKGKLFTEHNGARISTTLVTVLDPFSPIAETYHPIRMNLELGSSTRQIKTVVVTSAGVGEGKSMSAANLAVTMARGGHRTLLIDADLRRPKVGEIFGLRQDIGFAQMLKGTAVFSAESYASDVEGLYVLPAGGIVEDASNLIGSKATQAFLRQVAGDFDVIIIDTPPLLPVIDGARLAAIADATILVARAGKTKEKELQYAVERLQQVGATVVGTILNAFDLSMAYGYKYRYQGYSTYGPYADYVRG